MPALQQSVAQTRLRASIQTLGCRLNQAESRVLGDRLQAAGYTLCPPDAPVDLAVIHTCTVTREADAKCRKAIRACVARSPLARVVVMGCYAQMAAEAVAAIPGVDLVLGNAVKMDLLDHLLEDSGERPRVIVDKPRAEAFTVPFASDVPFSQRANLKVQDGCDFHCSFCIIPRARGPARSRAWADTLEEARASVANGVRELVLTGVNIGTYADAGRGIVALVDALAELPELWRVRISSIEPTTVPEALFERMADPAHNLQPYLHLPLQSGSDAVLASMRRRYSAADYRAFVEQAVARVPDLCVGTDVLVGLDGETEADFAATCACFDALPFAYAHVFPYSERGGTLSARRARGALPPPAVPVPERQRRVAVLRGMSARRQRAFAERFCGRVVEVLLEDPAAPGLHPGLTPEYVRVFTRVPEAFGDVRNRLARVELGAWEERERGLLGRFLGLVEAPLAMPALAGAQC